MTHPDFRRKLEAIGFGVFIPIFFVTSGVRFDLDALTASGSSLAMVPLFLLALLLVRGIPALVYRRLLTRREVLVAGLLQATSLPFLVAATAIGRELGLVDAGEASALVGAGLLSVLLFPAAGLALLRRHTQPKGSTMKTTCSSYADVTEAEAAVQRLLADGMPPARISIISGHTLHDERVGAFVGAATEVGAFAGMPGAIGSFAPGTGEHRHGSFGDVDRDEITIYENGTRHVHIASHHELEKGLAEAGLDAGAIAKDVAAVHDGRVLVLVTSG